MVSNLGVRSSYISHIFDEEDSLRRRGHGYRMPPKFDLLKSNNLMAYQSAKLTWYSKMILASDEKQIRVYEWAGALRRADAAASHLYCYEEHRQQRDLITTSLSSHLLNMIIFVSWVEWPLFIDDHNRCNLSDIRVDNNMH